MRLEIIKCFVLIVLLSLIMPGIVEGLDFSANVRVNSTTTNDQKEPVLAIDTNGTIHATWTDFSTTSNNGDVHYSKSVDGGGTWTTSINIDSATSTVKTDQPAITVNSSGNVFITWRDFRNDSTNADIFEAHSKDGGLTFTLTGASTGIYVNDAASTGAVEDPAVAAFGTSNVYIVWRDSRTSGNNGDIFFDKSTDGGVTFGTDTIVDTGGTAKAEKPAITVDNTGLIHVVWRDFRLDTTNGDIFYTKSSDGIYWTSVHVDDAGLVAADQPAVAVSPNGDIHVVWTDFRTSGNEGDIFYAKSTNGGASFGTNKNIDGAGITKADQPSIAIDTSGNINIMWRDFRNGDADIYSSRSIDGGSTFSKPTRVNDDTIKSGKIQLLPSVGVDPNGKAYAVWEDGRNGHFDIFSAKGPALTVPLAPTGVTATAGDKQIVLDWDDNTESDLAGYNVLRSTSSGGTFSKVNTTSITVSNFTNTALTNGTQYFFVIQAVDTSGNTSGNSEEVNGTPSDASAPKTPTNLTATAGNTLVDLSWTAPTQNADGSTLTDLAGYNVYRSISSGGDFTKINTSTVTVTTYQDTGLTNGTTFFYKVSAIDDVPNESVLTSAVSATPQVRGNNAAPSPPPGLTATGGNTIVDLSWTAPTINQDGSTLTDLAGYNVYRSISSEGTFTKINTSTVTVLSFQDTGRTNGTTYYYKVTAIDTATTANESNFSGVVSATPQVRGSAASPAVPANPAAIGRNTIVDLNWTTPSVNQDGSPLTDLAGYNIYRRTGSSGVYEKINSSVNTAATFQDTSRTNGTTYFYKITAVDTGSNESNFSAEASATPGERGSSVAPAPPTGLTATAGNTTVDLSWTAPATNGDGTTLTDLDGYNIYRATGSGGTFEKINTSINKSSTFQDTGRTNGTTYL
ncbi:MAG: fibronectin type III domain-containing protein [Candidatus Omnitrophica bacterium]|nr:fibronectin type III domain-containing protein [Candidatus Omnitrophota bacterium]